MYNKRSCRSTLKVHVKAKSKSEKAKTKVDRIMEITKTTLNKLVELIDENADEEDMCQIEDGIKDFWKSSTGKKYVVFITQLLENLENKIKQNSQDKKIRIAITKRFLSLVLFIGKEYQATLEVDRGSLLFTFYFETRLGYDRFSEDMRKGVIQQELSDVVQYEPFLGIFKLKKDDVMVEVEECTRNETDRTDENIEKKSKSKTIKPGDTIYERERISELPYTHCSSDALCVSERHSTHNIIDFSVKYQKLKNDMEELRVLASNIYEHDYSDTLQKKSELPQKYEIIKNKLKEEGQIWHDRMDAAVDMYIAALQSMQNKHLSTLELGIQKMKKALQEISEKISQNTEMLNQTSLKDIADYALDIERFRIIPEWSDFKFPFFLTKRC
ncbi:uncharacterized protein LOC125664497 isoform X2 [Ostrea edulis]|uniref:uncharacterized protein LOC125664497 isoform X2 n=1 Tax=Ostrea edulis TaxID=37623 RepID=UPI0024AE8D53|nr:uncharacterized protein LOC125664497 isoform X2 [Ostrea edulis]